MIINIFFFNNTFKFKKIYVVGIYYNKSDIVVDIEYIYPLRYKK